MLLSIVQGVTYVLLGRLAGRPDGPIAMARRLSVGPSVRRQHFLKTYLLPQFLSKSFKI